MWLVWTIFLSNNSTSYICIFIFKGINHSKLEHLPIYFPPKFKASVMEVYDIHLENRNNIFFQCKYFYLSCYFLSPGFCHFFVFLSTFFLFLGNIFSALFFMLFFAFLNDSFSVFHCIFSSPNFVQALYFLFSVPF